MLGWPCGFLLEPKDPGVDPGVESLAYSRPGCLKICGMGASRGKGVEGLDQSHWRSVL